MAAASYLFEPRKMRRRATDVPPLKFYQEKIRCRSLRTAVMNITTARDAHRFRLGYIEHVEQQLRSSNLAGNLKPGRSAAEIVDEEIRWLFAERYSMWRARPASESQLGQNQPGQNQSSPDIPGAEIHPTAWAAYFDAKGDSWGDLPPPDK